ncbi:MAG: nicotinamide-nucleotide amidohydrolase family protein [Candidatus Latescibacteria bacterium]|nr:nicotinamide-nucleotide amidohydrolase family protein [Candidatus Latescibacterota bacterium]
MRDLLDHAARLGAQLKERGDTLAIAESSAGGLLCAVMLAVPGASSYFKGGAAVYTGAAKQILMGVSDQDMAAARAATPQHAEYLAQAARQRLDATWGLGETGAAGPTGNRYGDPAGHTCIGIAGPLIRSSTLATGQNDRWDNMVAFAGGALNLLEKCLATAKE